MNERQGDKRTGWDTSPLVDHPVGPDDAGNAVMVGLGFIAHGWRWLTNKLTRRPTPP
jgi:hypothetical protein